MPVRLLCAVLLSALLLTACAEVVPPPRTADYYLQEGESFYADERYEDAIASWQKVRDNFYSQEMNTQAEFKIAEAHFLAEHYPEAAAAYDAFLKAHPDHPQSAIAIYRLGLSYYRQMLTPDRDQTLTRNALATFDNLLLRFPDLKERAEVETLMANCRSRLAAHELHIATFYLRTERYAAAIARGEELLKRYPDVPERAETYYVLGQAYLQIGARDKAAEAFNTLYRLYPDSPLIAKAQKQLEKRF